MWATGNSLVQKYGKSDWLFLFCFTEKYDKDGNISASLKSVEDFDQFAFITHKNRDNAE